VISKNNVDPNAGCTVTSSFTIGSNPGVLTVPNVTANIDKDDNYNCTNPNGFIEIKNIIRNGVPVAVTAGNYTFQWFRDPAGANTNITGTAVAGLTAVGTGNRIQDLDENTYAFIATNTTTGCATGLIQVNITDMQVDPIVSVQAGSILGDTFCDNTNQAGSGALSIDIFHAGVKIDNPITPATYVVEWYRGTTVQNTAHVDFLFDNQGNSNADANVIGDALTGADISDLTGLSSGTYTVFISKIGAGAIAPNLGCDIAGTFTVPKNQLIPTLSTSNIVANATNNTVCVPGFDGSYTANGSITINDADVSTGDLGNFEIIVEKTAVGSGDVRLNALNPLATTLTITDLESGVYFISARNTTTGCSAAAVRVNIQDLSAPPSILLVEKESNLNCAGGTETSGSISILANGVSDDTDLNFTFEWFVGPGIGAPLGNTAVLNNLGAGTYTARVRNVVTGCQVTREFVIIDEDFDPVIVNYEANNQTYCIDNGSFALLEVQLGANILDEVAMEANGYVLEVFTQVGNISQGTVNAAPYEITGLAAGDYYAMVTNPSSNCPSDPIDFEVKDAIILPVINIVVDQNDDPCSIGNGVISATADGKDDTNPNYTFTWYNYDNGTSTRGAFIANTSTISNLESGYYEVEVMNIESGCTFSQVGQLFQNDPILPIVDAFAKVNATTCTPGDGSITITAMNQDTPQDYVYDLYNANPNSSAPIATLPAGTPNPVEFTALVAGDYWIIATHGTRAGCVMAQPLQIRIEDNSTPPDVVFVSFVPNTRCDASTPNGEIHVQADGSTSTDPITGYTFTWTGVDQLGAPVVGLPNSADLTGIPAGTYNLTVTNNATGCSTAAAPYILTDKSPKPLQVDVTTAPNTNCINFNGQMAATVINNVALLDYQYLWFIGNQANPDLNAPDYTGTLVTGLQDGNYTLVVRENPANDVCMSAVIPVVIRNNTNNTYTPLVEIVRDRTYCYDDITAGLGYARVTNSDLALYTIEWFSLANPLVPVSISNTFYVENLLEGNYEVVMTNQISGCEYTTEFSILDIAPTVANPTVSKFSDETNCVIPNGEVRVDVNGETSGYRFDWFNATDTGLTTVLFSGSQPSNLSAGNYIIRATNLTTGCESGTSTVSIERIITEPDFEIIATNSLCLRTEDGAINQFNGDAYIKLNSFNFVVSAAWYDASGNRLTSTATGDDITDPAINGLAPGNYTVTFEADNGCFYDAAFEVSTAVQVFNFVTANGDTKNDFFLIDCLDFFPNNNVQIFTRAGQRIYEADGYNNADVRFEGFSDRGKALPAGTYFYIIDRGDGSELVNGYLELLR
jgi:gliding motility-associated-like protein